MNWIKHMANAHKDEKLVSIRATLGMWGIGVFWTLVELVAEQITEKSDKAVATLVIPELLGLFGCKRNKLDSFLEHSSNVSIMKTVVEGNILQVDIPKILDFADNYIKYGGRSLKSLQRQKKMSLSQNRIEKNRIEKKKIGIPLKITIPESLNNQSFIDAFGNFIEHRKEMKKPLTQRAINAILKKLSQYSLVIAVAMVDQTLENGWQGIFELKDNNRLKIDKPEPESGYAAAKRMGVV